MPSDLTLVAASEFSAAELASLFTASFGGYVVPMAVDEAAFVRMARLFDFDLGASRVARRGDRPVGLVNLGIRGRRAWIGGMGVVPEERGAGVGEALMVAAHDAARARGVDEVRLEVITSNAAAIGLYEKLGYAHARELEIWRLDVESPSSTAREAPARQAHRRVRSLRREREPWQRDDRTLELLLAEEPLRGLVADGAAAVLHVDGGGAVVEQVAARDVDAGAEVLAGALARARPVRLANLPAGDPVGAAFARLGGTVALRQHELRLQL